MIYQVQIMQMDLQASTTSIMITLEEYNQLKQQNRLLSHQKVENAKTIIKLTNKYDRLLNDFTKRLQELAKLKQNAKELSIRTLRSMNEGIKKDERMRRDLELREEEVVQACQQRENLKIKLNEAEAETIKINYELDHQNALLEVALKEKTQLTLFAKNLEHQLKERVTLVTQLQAKLTQARLQDQYAFSEMQAQLKLKEAECISLKEEVGRLEKDNLTNRQTIYELNGHSKIVERERDDILKTCQNFKQRVMQKIEVRLDYCSYEHELSNSSLQDQSSMLYHTEANRDKNNPYEQFFDALYYQSISSINSNYKQLKADNEILDAKNKQLKEKCKQLNDELTHLSSQLAQCTIQLADIQSLAKQKQQNIKRLEEVLNERQIVIRQSKTRIEQMSKEIQQHSLQEMELKPKKGSERDTKDQSSEAWKVSSGISQWDSMEKSSILAEKDRLQESLFSQQQKSQILDRQNRQLKQKYDHCKFQYSKYKTMATELKEKYEKVKGELKKHTEHSNP